MATYYVAASGNDTHAGTSTGTAWQTSAKVQSSMGSFAAGDFILFNGGDTFLPFTINVNGSAGNQITFTSYGTGQANISGFTTISSWTNIGGGIYQSNVLSPDSVVTVLLINGTQYKLGRYPTSSFLPISSTGTNQVTTSTTLSNTYTGGQIVSRNQHFIYDIATITGQSSNTLTYGTGMAYAPQTGWGFFIQNNINCLFNFGDWMWDSTSNTVKVFFGGGGTGGFTVLVGTSDIGIDVSSTYNTITNLNIEGLTQYGVAAQTGPKAGLVVSNCNFNYIGWDGTYCVQQTSPIISNNTYMYCGSNSINMKFQNTSATITGNIITNSGMIAGGGKVGFYNGITTSASATISGNNIQGVGYCGISFTGNTGNLVQNNYISSFCNILDDGAGIYANAITGSSPANNTIDQNVILNGTGLNAGTDYVGIPLAHGIYLDSALSGITLSNNTCSSAAYSGIFIHGNNHFVLDSNTLYNNGATQLFIQDDAGILVQNGNIINNIFYSKSGQLCLSIQNAGVSTSDMVPSIGTFSNNAYCRPSDETNIINSNYSFTNHFFNLASWKSTYSLDSGSNSTPTNLGGAESFNTNPSTGSVSLIGTWTDMFGNSNSGSVSLSSYSSLLLLQTSTGGGSPIVIHGRRILLV